MYISHTKRLECVVCTSSASPLTIVINSYYHQMKHRCVRFFFVCTYDEKGGEEEESEYSHKHSHIQTTGKNQSLLWWALGENSFEPKDYRRISSFLLSHLIFSSFHIHSMSRSFYGLLHSLSLVLRPLLTRPTINFEIEVKSVVWARVVYGYVWMWIEWISACVSERKRERGRLSRESVCL